MTTLIYGMLIYNASSIMFVVALGTLGWWRNRVREKQTLHNDEDAKRSLPQQIELAVAEAQTAPLYKKGDLSW